MQAVRDPHLSERVSVNWRAGIFALAGAFCLASWGVTYHSAVSIGGAAMIAVYALLVPLRVPNRISSWPSRRFVLQLMLRAAPILGALYCARFAVNSGLPVIDAIGNALFIGLLVLGGAIVFRAGKRTMLKSLSPATAAFTKALTSIRAQVNWVFLSFPRHRSW
jgi:hypothetical protein